MKVAVIVGACHETPSAFVGSRTINRPQPATMSKEKRDGELVRLRRRVAAARVMCIAVCADTAATLQAIHRDRAARRRVGCHAESDDMSFTVEGRSRFRS